MNEQIKKLYSWVQSPHPPHAITEILTGLTDFDLISLMIGSDGPAGRIAWAEYGRRRKFADMQLHATEMDGVLELEFSGSAKAIHAGPILDQQ